jgi:hypothetical protein
MTPGFIGNNLVRVAGVEPASWPWEGHIIAVILHPPALTASATIDLLYGATYQDRTGDLRVTSASLYQLS